MAAHWMLRRLNWLWLLILLVGSPLVQADALGSLEGTVVDDTDGPLGDVWIQLAGDPVRTSSLTDRTNSQGEFRLAGVPPGEYEVTASREGFQVVTLRRVVIQPQQVRRVRMVLVPGVLTDEHRRVAEAPPAFDRDSLGLMSSRRQARGPQKERSLAEMTAPVVGMTSFPLTPGGIRGDRPASADRRLRGFSLLSPFDRSALLEEGSGGFLGWLLVHRGGAPVSYGDHISGVVELVPQSGRGMDRAFGGLGYRTRLSGGEDPEAGGENARWGSFTGWIGGEIGPYGYFVSGDLLRDEAESDSLRLDGDHRRMRGTWIGTEFQLFPTDELAVIVGLEDEWRDPRETYENLGYNGPVDHREAILVSAHHRHRLSAARLFDIGYQYTEESRDAGARAGTRAIKAPEDYDLAGTGEIDPDWPLWLENREMVHRFRGELLSAADQDRELRFGLEAELATLDLAEGWIEDPEGGENPLVGAQERVYRLAAYARTRWNTTRRLVTMPGLRLDYFDPLDGGLRISPRLGLVFTPTPGLVLGAGVGRFVARPPLRMVLEEPLTPAGDSRWGTRGTDLEPERALQLEATARLQGGTLWRSTVALFHREISDRAGLVPGEDGRLRFTELEDYRFWGGEIELELGPWNGLIGRIGYGYTHGRGPDAFQGVSVTEAERLPFPTTPEAFQGEHPTAWTAPHRFSLELDHRLRALGGMEATVRLVVQSGLSYTGANLGVDDLEWEEINGRRLPSTTRLDAWVVKSIPVGGPVALDIELRGANLLDEPGYRRVDPLTGRPPAWSESSDTWAGRSVSLGGRLRF